MINFSYSYLPTTPNNKLFYLEQIIEGLPSNEKITVIVKNDVQSNEINTYLKTKCIQSVIIKKAEDITEINSNEKTIFIVAHNNTTFMKNTLTGTIISLYGSGTTEELLNKVNMIQTTHKCNIVELISKIDFTFISTLYKFSEIQVERYTIKSENILSSHSDRVATFIQNCISSKEISEKLFDISSSVKKIYQEKIQNLFNEETKLSFFEDFFLWTCFTAKLPILDITESYKKEQNSIQIIVNAGSTEELSQENITSYFEKVKDVTQVTVLSIEENQTTVTLQGKNLKTNNIIHFMETNPFKENVTLSHLSIQEIEIPYSQNSQGKNNSFSYKKERYGNYDEERGERYSSPRREGRFGGRDRDRGGYFKRDNDGGGYRKRDNDGGGYFKRDNDNNSGGYFKRDNDGGGFRKRDNDYKPRHGGGGFPKRDGEGSSFRPRKSFDSFDKDGNKEQKSFSKDSSFSFNHHDSGFNSKFKNNDRRGSSFKKGYQKNDKTLYDKKSKYSKFNDESFDEDAQ